MKEFEYYILGNHPIFKYVNKKCSTIEEVETIKSELLSYGYEVHVKKLEKN